MFIYTRSVIANSKNSQEIAGLLNEGARNTSSLTGLQTRVHRIWDGTPGQYGLSIYSPDLAGLTKAGLMMMADPAHVQRVTMVEQLANGIGEERIIRVLGGAVDPNGPGPFVAVMDSVATAAGFADGIKLLMESANRLKELGATTSMVIGNVIGHFNGLLLATSFASEQEHQAVLDQARVDPTLLRIRASAAGLFVDSMSRSALMRQIS